MRTLLGLFGILVTLTSLLFVFAAIGDLAGGDSDTETGILVGLLVFFSGTAATGGWFAKRMLGARRASGPAPVSAAEIERTVLAEAKSGGGRLTVTELAANTDLSLAEAEAILEKLCHTGIAQMRFTDDHQPVYAFPGLMSTAEKAQAKDPLA